MSNLPDDYRNAQMAVIILECGQCGHTWDAKAIKDFGTYNLYDQDDSQCPSCKKGIGE